MVLESSVFWGESGIEGQGHIRRKKKKKKKFKVRLPERLQ